MIPSKVLYYYYKAMLLVLGFSEYNYPDINETYYNFSIWPLWIMFNKRLNVSESFDNPNIMETNNNNHLSS
jgi:hypothetical protein